MCAMHPNRRRKKRPNYGLRTVEVARGPNGFGFTISGQQPCILSCIVAQSPADHAGLRAGDFLISVNGIPVSKIAHDAVVNLIGKTSGPIRMAIAEYYYSDSSDEEQARATIATRKHKPRHAPRRKKDDGEEEGAFGPSPPAAAAVCNPMEDEGGPIEYKAIVGYLGTIEMPKQLPVNSRLQTVNSCIKKLRQEKRKPTAVLMTVLPTCLTLKNSLNHILAIYPTNRVVYVSSTADRESRYFGLVTSAVCDRSLEHVQKKCETSFVNMWDERKRDNNDRCELEVSNSCHVFVTDPKIVDHALHAQKAESFRVVCTRDVITGYCLEFPRNALYIVSLVQNMYRLQAAPENKADVGGELVANSPQPSASSNSDSGIGFRDDCGNVSDRILLVEFPALGENSNNNNHNHHHHLPNNHNRPINIIANSRGELAANMNLNNVRVMPANVSNIRACENLSIRNTLEDEEQKGSGAVASLPSKKINTFSERAIDVQFGSMDNVSVQSWQSLDGGDVFKKPSSCVSAKKRPKRLWQFIGGGGGGGSSDHLDDYKLSPKVYMENRDACNSRDEEEFGGSLRDVSMVGRKLSAVLAQSEPDVRIDHLDMQDKCCEDGVLVKVCGDGPAAWATSFEELLKCSAGLHAFAAFLKMEFSAENIYFWTACERFRHLRRTENLKSEAARIYKQHVRVGAAEAVNVDSKARQCAEQHLHNVSVEMFAQAQKQIFNLMKFDSYTRFLKSELYKQCLAGDAPEYKLDPNLLLHPQTCASPTATPLAAHKPKRSLSNAEDRRRKSLLPWHRKNRSKSKESKGGDLDAQPLSTPHDHNDNNVDMRSSKSSLTSLDMGGITSASDITKVNNERIANGRHPLCRVKLSNGTSTMTQLKQDENIESLVKRLLEKRGISYSAFTVYTNKEAKALNPNDSSYRLAGCEVSIEQRVCFKLHLPNKKIIAVKSKASKVFVDVLCPILEKYSFRLEDVHVQCNNLPINVSLQVTSFDNARIFVHLKDLPTAAALEEITNRVYEDILQEKAASAAATTESVKSEDWGSEHSSTLGRFLKRDSNRKKKHSLGVRKPASSQQVVVLEEEMMKKPLIAKLKVGVQLHNTSESEDLYEGLNRAQRGRLDDQRGTQINFAMPDFLKGQQRTLEKSTTCPNLRLEPPPLPPKPKIVPMKPSNWKPRGDVLQLQPPPGHSHKECSYLEQPTSSFV